LTALKIKSLKTIGLLILYDDNLLMGKKKTPNSPGKMIKKTNFAVKSVEMKLLLYMLRGF
jgi:hypothetical protein